jgi:hypothetical protein
MQSGSPASLAEMTLGLATFVGSDILDSLFGTTGEMGQTGIQGNLRRDSTETNNDTPHFVDNPDNLGESRLPIIWLWCRQRKTFGLTSQLSYVEVDDLHQSAFNALRTRIWLRHNSNELLDNVEEQKEDVVAEAFVSDFRDNSS